MHSRTVRVVVACALAAGVTVAVRISPPGLAAAAAASDPATTASRPATSAAPATRPAASRPAVVRDPKLAARFAKANVADMEVAAIGFELDVARYPTTEEGLRSLVERPKGVKDWHGPYLDRIIPDPWGHPYQYRSPGKHNPTMVDVWSFGPDGREGTGDEIGNW